MRGLVRSDNREVMRCCCMVTKWGYRKTGNRGLLRRVSRPWIWCLGVCCGRFASRKGGLRRRASEGDWGEKACASRSGERRGRPGREYEGVICPHVIMTARIERQTHGYGGMFWRQCCMLLLPPNIEAF